MRVGKDMLMRVRRKRVKELILAPLRLATAEETAKGSDPMTGRFFIYTSNALQNNSTFTI